MKQFLISTIAFMLVLFSASAQQSSPEGARETNLKQAKYLKSIYKTEAAIALLSDMALDYQMDEEIMAELADCYLQAADLQAASSAYTRLSEYHPNKVLYKVKLMNIAYRNEDYQVCTQIGRAISELDTIPSMIALTGDSYNKIGDYDSALSWYERYLAINPRNANVVNKAAKIHLDRKQYDTVLGMVNSYLEGDPSNMDIRGIKGLVYYLKGDYRASERVFQKMVDDGNNTYSAHFYLGQNQWHNNKHFYARQELEKAWQIDSSDVNLAYTIASVILESGMRMKEAGPWLDKAMEMVTPDPVTVARIYRLYGSGYSKQEDYKRTVEYYMKSYETDSSAFSALSNIAYAYERMKDWKHARQYYEEYLKFGKPGSSGYEFAKESLEYVKQQLFMEEK